MQEATLQLFDVKVDGLTLDDIGQGLSELTINLQTVVSAEALGKLLGSLAELYRIGFAAAGKPEMEFISFGNEFISPQDLIITELKIGTPNMVKVCGCSSVLDDLYKIMKILTLAAALSGAAPTPTASGDLDHNVTIVVDAPESARENPVTTMLELQRALNANITMRMNLDRAHANGEIPLHSYLEQIATLDTAAKDLNAALSVTRTRLGS